MVARALLGENFEWLTHFQREVRSGALVGGDCDEVLATQVRAYQGGERSGLTMEQLFDSASSLIVMFDDA